MSNIYLTLKNILGKSKVVAAMLSRPLSDAYVNTIQNQYFERRDAIGKAVQHLHEDWFHVRSDKLNIWQEVFWVRGGPSLQGVRDL
jgi:hypothetical protein